MKSTVNCSGYSTATSFMPVSGFVFFITWVALFIEVLAKMVGADNKERQA